MLLASILLCSCMSVIQWTISMITYLAQYIAASLGLSFTLDFVHFYIFLLLVLQGSESPYPWCWRKNYSPAVHTVLPSARIRVKLPDHVLCACLFLQVLLNFPKVNVPICIFTSSGWNLFYFTSLSPLVSSNFFMLPVEWL